MKKRKSALFAISALVCIVSACNDESSRDTNGDTSCQCAENQVCAANGICYDDPGCAKCEAEQVCVGGVCFANDHECAQCSASQSCVNKKCYDAGHACAKCSPEQVCVGSKCYDASHKCAQCKEDQVCTNDTCYDAGDPCAKCSENQVCIGKQCRDKTDPCAKCREDQVCANDTCYEEGDPCISCTKDQNCIDGRCIDPNDKSCESECTAPDYCEDGVCQKCENVCEDNCCGDGQTCDVLLKQCGQACEDPGQVLCGDDCCSTDQECDQNFGCIPVCVEGESTRCEGESSVSCCSDAKEECLAGSCVPLCKGTRCGEDQSLCCEGKTPVCEENVCKITCDKEKRCGASDEFCCKSDQLCINNVCVKHSDHTCSKSSDCNFDEICEESNLVCINEDEIPSTCQVIPKFNKFNAILQWHWPKTLEGGVPLEYPDYYRVVVTPLVANFTDDNNDTVVDENDIPDVVFLSYPKANSPDHFAPTIIRVISGDDGHEIASSKPRYWTHRSPIVVADVDNDGKVEIAGATNLHHVWTGSGGQKIDFTTGEDGEYLEVLEVVPNKESPTGFSMHTDYQLPIPHGQRVDYLSVADLDMDGTPEIITDHGIASVVTKDGKKELAWREGCENKSATMLHAADLDGDHIMELFNSAAIYDDHCNLLVGGGQNGYSVVADFMPDSEDAAETGELTPEIATTISGAGGGEFQFWKIYKKVDDEGKATWTKKKVWTAPIPVDKNRPQYAGCLNGQSSGYCQSAGGPPVVADFDNDKDHRPDIGVASRYYYIVYSNDGTPNGGKVLWADGSIVDYSSGVTGSSVFDFEGDGVAEVIYGDEQKMRIYTGKGTGKDEDGDGYPDPEVLFSVNNFSATGIEYPVIVDVDNDGSTEIIVVSDYLNNNEETVGVRAFEDPGGQWVRTRRIWNEHNYHVTNINEDGTVPKQEIANWTHPKLNNYRQNVQPSGVYNAPNLVATGMTSDQKDCEKGILKLTAKVENQGSLGIKAGLSVKFYAVVTVDGKEQKVLIGEKKVETVMPPGSNASVTLDWDQEITVDGKKIEIKSPIKIYYVVDEPTEGKSFGEFVECKEDDNATAAQDVELCPIKVN